MLFESGQSDSGVYVGVAAENVDVDDGPDVVEAEGCAVCELVPLVLHGPALVRARGMWIVLAALTIVSGPDSPVIVDRRPHLLLPLQR